MREGDILENRYQILREIGQGGTGVIYLAYHLTLQKYVIVKKVKENFTGLINVRGEADILKRLHHTCLPQVYDFIQVGTAVYTVMEYIEGTDLMECVRRGMHFEEQTLIFWLKQLCQVLDYLHSQETPIYHSDIKPGNIMLTSQGNVCLIDFNISLMGETEPLGISPWFAAPEQYIRAVSPGEGGALDGRMDIYSLAATFYWLMCGSYPRPDAPNAPLGLFDIPYSDGLKAVIDKAMEVSPARRFGSAGAMEKALEGLERMDPAYRRLTFIQWVSAGIYGFFAVLCILLIYYGVSVSRREAWQKDWGSFYQAYVGENAEEVIRQGISLLNSRSYQKIMEEEERREILYAVGESYYKQEDYVTAARYYGEAAGGSEEAEYYRDYAIALAKSGQGAKASSVLKEAEPRLSEDEQFALVQGEILYGEGRYEEALEKLVQVRKKSGNRELRAKACLTAADIYGILGRDAEYLACIREARTYDSGPETLRLYGEALCRLAEGQKEYAEEYYTEALECYEILCSRTAAVFEDWMSLAAVRLSLGRYEECRDGLGALAEEYPQDYRIYLMLTETFLLDGVRADEATERGEQLRENYRKAKEFYKGHETDTAMEELIGILG